MKRQKKVLVLGATGAMGRYLVPRLAEDGYLVDAVALDKIVCGSPNVRAISGNAKEWPFLRELTAGRYDGIVDFMIYPSSEICIYPPWLMERTEHYIYLSSYRIYDNKEHPVRESSPRLLDASEDVLLRNSDDYSIYKARGENIVRSMPRKNWTIIRPAITYSRMRYQLVTLEAPCTVGRAFAGKRAVLPQEAKNVQGTMSWAGDVAQMIAKLLFNEKALGETFTVATSEHHTWGEIADYYQDICHLEVVWVPKEDYLQLFCDNPGVLYNRWQLEYDRLFDRIMDNSKVLAATGMEQSGLTPLYDGLEREISRCPKDTVWPVWRINAEMDGYLKEKGL